MDKPLSNRVAVVTGASRGIGRAAALALAEAGAHIIALARTQGALEQLDDEIRARGTSATLVPVNLKDLEARFDDGAEVTPATLAGSGLATRKNVPVKILGVGDVSKKLTVSAHGFSKTAREKIEGAGGSCTLLDV